MAQSSLISLNNITKSFSNGTVALRDMALDVQQGEFVSLLGPSGCGKSTALRIIAGLAPATIGTVSWGNVYLPLKLKGQSKANARDAVIEALTLVGLEQFSNSYPRELSGGMKMRVSIARALVTRPRLLLMDEPFAALDEITRFKLNNDLLELWQRFNWTVIFVTHSVFESVYLSNRIVVMASRPGRVVDDIAIDAPYPRDEAFRTSDVYSQYCREVSNALHKAMDPFPAGAAA